MFCTGGIRCEKAGPFMEREGFEQVFQLDGGILKYFEDCGGDHYEGECFVFDQRVGVDPQLSETDDTLCFNCQTPLTKAEQDDPRRTVALKVMRTDLDSPELRKRFAQEAHILGQLHHAGIVRR